MEKTVPKWEKRLRIVLEIVMLYVGVFQIVFGSIPTGVFILLCLIFILFPRYITRNKVTHLPIEIEILLFLMVVLQYILGGIHEFYTRIPYYDKLVHFMLPMFTGIIGFLVAYTMYATGRLRASLLSMVIIIALFSLAVGAIWEIIEYLSDVLIYPYMDNWHHFQGNAQQTANTDTMTDLIDDFLGGIFGALLGVIFIHRNGKNGRVAELTKNLESQLFK